MLALSPPNPVPYLYYQFLGKGHHLSNPESWESQLYAHPFLSPPSANLLQWPPAFYHLNLFSFSYLHVYDHRTFQGTVIILTVTSKQLTH